MKITAGFLCILSLSLDAPAPAEKKTGSPRRRIRCQRRRAQGANHHAGRRDLLSRAGDRSHQGVSHAERAAGDDCAAWEGSESIGQLIIHCVYFT